MKIWKKAIHWFVRYFVISIYYLVKLLPLGVCVYAGGIIGYILFIIVKRERKRSIENLRKAFPEKSGKEVFDIAKKVFINQGKNLFELMCFPRLSGKRFWKHVKMEGRENLRLALEKGNGAIILMAHFGCWELLAASIPRAGFPMNAIARRINDRVLNKHLVRLRSIMGFGTILRGESPRTILKTFKENKVLAILLDQYSSRFSGVYVDFFDMKCYTSNGIASIVSRSDIPVIPAFIVRGRRGHTVYIDEPVKVVKLENREQEILENTQLFTGIIEKWVRKYPEQWVWMHDRWRIHS